MQITLLRNVASKFEWCLILLLLLFSGIAAGDINFGGATRFIFDAAQKQKAITITNTGQKTVLVQAVLDPGEVNQGTHEIPMVLSKPLLKIPANDRRSVDILYQGAGLAQDRESYFLLSVTEIPLMAEQINVLQIALRHRLKLFFRPPLPTSIDDAFTKLYWTQPPHSALVPVQVHNVSPYYLTLTEIQLFDSQGGSCGSKVEHLMAAPFSILDVSAPDCTKPATKITYTLISDEGLGLPYVFNINVN